jgi:hypothetical protein
VYRTEGRTVRVLFFNVASAARTAQMPEHSPIVIMCPCRAAENGSTCPESKPGREKNGGDSKIPSA